MSEQIDLETLFSDPKNMPEFIPDYSIDEIDQALNDALAEINENHPNLEDSDELMTPKSELTTPSGSVCNFKNENDSILSKPQSHQPQSYHHSLTNMKPLSPESLVSDTSITNSPRLEGKGIDQSQVIESIASIKSQIIDSHNTILTYQTLKQAYQTKCKDMDKIMKELQKSEMMRLKLMEENDHLKKIVMSLTMKE